MNITSKRISFFLSLFTAVILVVSSCKHEPPETTVVPDIDPATTQYPLEIAKIFITKCAVAGCHNEKSYKAAGSLRMDDWGYMFDGSSNGAVAIPYSPENSSLLYFLNPGSYDELTVEPLMPFNEEPLSKEEYDLVKQWVTDGCPDKNGNIPFGSMASTRQKYYQTQQGCDLLGVIDAEKKVIMRYVKLGNKPNAIESPHFVHIDEQGKYAYTCFIGGTVIQKIDVAKDSVVKTLDLSQTAGLIAGGASINVIKVSPDGTQLVASQLLSPGSIFLIDAVNMELLDVIATLSNPHGIAYNQAFDTLYITGQFGNTVFKVPTSGRGKEEISIDGQPTNTLQNGPNPHEIFMTPDYSKYFLTCENTNDIRVIDRVTNSLLKVIPVGLKPQELAVSRSRPYVIVTCMEDNSPNAGFKGSVYVIDYNTLEIVKRIDGSFYQPHGVAIDDKNGTFIIASRNSNPNGPAPHHSSDCGGRNGYYQVFDLNTLEPLNGRRYEVTPEPYSMDIRFK